MDRGVAVGRGRRGRRGRRGGRGGGGEEERRRQEAEEKEEATDIKSNNPHLAGGEKTQMRGINRPYWVSNIS